MNQIVLLTWINWTEEISSGLVAVLFLCLVLLSVFSNRRNQVRPRNIILVCFITLAAFCLAMGAGYVWMEGMIYCTGHIPAFPALLWPWRSGLLLVSLAGSQMVLLLPQHQEDAGTLYLGYGWSWWLLSFASVLALPGVAGTLLLPLSLIILLAAGQIGTKHSRSEGGLLVLLVIFPFSLVPATQLEAAHGYGHLFFVFLLPPMALFSISLLPLLYALRLRPAYNSTGRRLLSLLTIILLYNLVFEALR